GGHAKGPVADLVMDAGGNLYGTTGGDGTYRFGSVFKLTHGGGGWTYTSLHDFTGGSDGLLPRSNLVFDGSGNLYSTAYGGVDGNGVVFQITP
ncbi:MAG TPA: choice-of-anchor tandem repeat GloVer-containing protein, partial [Candidatus Limnocylindrales bacterium]|nr:choice-of-anchor tandem repeat GloVer-containing protein [Candidatus Limnocylindrales bacterium]